MSEVNTSYAVCTVEMPNLRPDDLFESVPTALDGEIQVDARDFDGQGELARCASLFDSLSEALRHIAAYNLLPRDDGTDKWAVLLEIKKVQEIQRDDWDTTLLRLTQTITVLDARQALEELKAEYIAMGAWEAGE